MSEIALLKSFEGMPSQRRGQGKRHSLQLCLALFTLAVAAGNQGFEAIGDWLKYHWEELTQLLGVDSLPSYSTIRRVLLGGDYVDYAANRSRTRIGFLPNLWAITRNLAINLYREAGFTNMVKAQRYCGYGLKHILVFFRMK